MSDILDFYKSMGILFCFFLLCAGVLKITEPEPANITDTIVNKETIHLHKFMESSPDYYIYTDSYCFNVNLHDYNSLNVGDNVTLSVTANNGSATLFLNGGEYYNV